MRVSELEIGTIIRKVHDNPAISTHHYRYTGMEGKYLIFRGTCEGTKYNPWASGQSMRLTIEQLESNANITVYTPTAEETTANDVARMTAFNKVRHLMS